MTAEMALKHPWLQRPEPSDGPNSPTVGVIQRIQRFGGFNPFKKELCHELANKFIDHSQARRREKRDHSKGLESDRLATGASSGVQTRSQKYNHQQTSVLHGAQIVGAKVAGPGYEGFGRARGLLEHLLGDNGNINRDALRNGLESMGYRTLTDKDLDHLFAQLRNVPGLDCYLTNSQNAEVTPQDFAASQLDASDSEEWTKAAYAAFDALDLDGDGYLQRWEMEAFLLDRNLTDSQIHDAVEQVMIDAGLSKDATSLDFTGFMTMLNAGMEPSKTLDRYASMRMTADEPALITDARFSSVSAVFRDACSSSILLNMSACGNRAVFLHKSYAQGLQKQGSRSNVFIPEVGDDGVGSPPGGGSGGSAGAGYGSNDAPINQIAGTVTRQFERLSSLSSGGTQSLRYSGADSLALNRS